MFDKITTKSNSINKAIDKLNIQMNESTNHEDKNKIEEEIAKEILKQKSDKLVKEIGELKNLSSGRSTKVFRIKEKIMGKKKQGQVPEAIEDVETGEMLVEKDDITNMSLKYCVKLLTNKDPPEGFEKKMDSLVKIHDVRMKIQNESESESEDEEDSKLTKIEFENLIQKFKSKNKHAYDFLTKAGEGLQETIFKICELIWNSENIPEQFDLTTIIQLWKGKGRRESLLSQRFIHSKPWFPRLFEGLVVQKITPKLVKNMSKFQIACKPGHRSQEHLFVMKSMIGLHHKMGTP